MNLIILGGVFLNMWVQSAYGEALEVNNNKKYYGVEFQLEDQTIISDSTNYFIGKTKNYLFYYKEKEKQSFAYPMNRIKMISFKRK